MWTLPPCKRRQFKRNALAQVVAELSYDPILKIDAYVPDFQESVRRLFPKYSIVQERVLEVVGQAALAPMQVRTETRHVFSDTRYSVTLSRTSLRIQTQDHTTHRDLAEAFVHVGSALRNIARISSTRLGIRYIDIIDVATVCSVLGEDVTLSDLVQPSYLATPLTDLVDTKFSYELNSRFAKSSDHMTVRWGCKSETTQFVLDVDRFRTAPIPADELESLIVEFTGDVFAVFMSAITPRFVEYLEKESKAND